MVRKKRDSDASIEKIEISACLLFAQKGYSNTSLENVAEDAGFTKGAVYYYFKTKEFLLLHIIEKITNRSIIETAENVRALQTGAIEKLSIFVKLQALWAAKYPDDLVILIATSLEFRDPDSPVRDAIKRYYKIMETLLTEIFILGKSSGEINSDLDIGPAVLTNMARHDGNMLLWHRSGRDPEVGRVLTAASVEAVKRFRLNKIKAKTNKK